MLTVIINHNLRCEVDAKKCDCLKERPHCHVTRNGIRVAQVWLDPVLLESGHLLEPNEVVPVIGIISIHRNDILQEYFNNQKYGEDC